MFNSLNSLFDWGHLVQTPPRLRAHLARDKVFDRHSRIDSAFRKASSEGARVQHRDTVMIARLPDRLECVARCLVHGIHRGAEEQEEVRAHFDRPPPCFRVIHHL